MQRRLEAVLAADVVGYSRLMNQDADVALDALRRLRLELFGPTVAGHHGKLVKSMGDGWIVTFPSAVDAVTCAMRIQDKLTTQDKIRLRMGLHIGDVTHEADDVFGEGVNVAARLEALCDPGSIAISEAVFSTLDGTLRPVFDDAGERTLKNIDRPVRVWTRGGLTGAMVKPQKPSGLPMLGIIPVKCSDDRPEVQELANGLAHDLERYLNQTRWLQTSVQVDPAPESFILTALLRARGDKLRLETRLSAPDGTMLWAGKTDGALADAFDWQDDVSETVASHTYAALTERIAQDLSAKHQSELTGHDYVVLSLSRAKSTVETLPRLLEYAKKAIEKDPELGIAYETAAAYVSTTRSIGFHALADEYEPYLEGWLKKANELSSGSSSSRGTLILANYMRHGDAAATRTQLNGVLRDLPFELETLMMVGYTFNFWGEPEKALECFSRCGRLAKYHPNIGVARTGTAISHVMQGKFELALSEAEDAVQLTPHFVTAYRAKMSALANLGRLDEARAAHAAHDRLIEGITVDGLRRTNRIVDNEMTRVYLDGMAMAGMPLK